MSRLVVDKFSELTDNFTSPHARRKVLAGVVMTTGDVAVRCSAFGESARIGRFSPDVERKQRNGNRLLKLPLFFIQQCQVLVAP